MPRTLSLSLSLSGSAWRVAQICTNSNGDSNTQVKYNYAMSLYTNLPGISASLDPYPQTTGLGLRSASLPVCSLGSSFFHLLQQLQPSRILWIYVSNIFMALPRPRTPPSDMRSVSPVPYRPNVSASRANLAIIFMPFVYRSALWILLLLLLPELCLACLPASLLASSLLVWKNDAVAQIRCLLKVEFRASPIVVGLIKLAKR